MGGEPSANASGVAGVIGRLKPLTANCDGPLNGYVALDMSATGRGDQELLEERMQVASDTMDQVAACGGHLKVVAFSSSAAETFTLGEADFPASGSTETARFIEADKAEGEARDKVEEEIPTAEKQLNPNGSDVIAQLHLAQQYQLQRGEGVLNAVLATDGIATTKPIKMNTPSFTADVARKAANQIRLPSLKGAEVRIVGVGKSTGARQLHTKRTQAITAFYSIACRRTGAKCLVTTDYTTRGG
jgi:hypothetical protein